MPNRILRDWTDSEAVNLISRNAETLFVRLIMKADDYGNYTANPKLIRSQCYPLLVDSIREADISRWIAECEKAGLIALYSFENKELLHIVSFGQRLRDSRPKFPAYSQELAATRRDFRPETETETETETKREREQACASVAPSRGMFPTVEAAKDFAKGQLLPIEAVENWHANREAQGWVRGNGLPITNWQSDLRAWINREGRGEFKPSTKGKNHDHRADKRSREFAESTVVPDLE